MLSRIIGLTMAASAALVTGISLSPPAQARGSVWDRVAACESGGRWGVNSGNGYYGGVQFSAATWRVFGGTRYASQANRASKAIQIAIARRVLYTQGPGAWPVCSRRAGLTRANGHAFNGAAFMFKASRSNASRSTVSRSRARVASVGYGRLAVDGQLGPMTIRAIQRWVGVSRTGRLDSRTIRALQRKCGATPDGAIGPRTIYRLQIRIGVRRTGARNLNAATVAALQRYFNLH